MKKIINARDYQETCRLKLIEAEKALKSPCVEDAAWAIHNGTENENADVISKAYSILQNYYDALEAYEKALSS